jgi:hypothetical protein
MRFNVRNSVLAVTAGLLAHAKLLSHKEDEKEEKRIRKYDDTYARRYPYQCHIHNSRQSILKWFFHFVGDRDDDPDLGSLVIGRSSDLPSYRVCSLEVNYFEVLKIVERTVI